MRKYKLPRHFSFGMETSDIVYARELAHPDNDYSQLEKYLLRVVDVVPFNPSDEGKREATRETYHPCDEAPLADASCIPHPAAIKRLEDSLSDPRQGDRVCFVVGGRGAGKTAVVGYVLDRLHDSWVQQGVVWFRTDVKRLFLDVRDQSNQKIGLLPRPALDVYTVAHALYVALAHPSDPAFSEFTHAQTGFLDFLRASKYENNKRLALVCESIFGDWENTKQANSSVAENHEGDRAEKSFVSGAAITIEQKQNEYGDALLAGRLWTSLVAYLRERRRISAVALVLDGVDNIDRRSGNEAYEVIISQLRGLISHWTMVNKMLVVVREETRKDLERSHVIEAKYPLNRFVVRMRQPKEALLKKSIVAKAPTSTFLKSRFEVLAGALPNSAYYLSGYELFCGFYESALPRLLKPSKFETFSVEGRASNYDLHTNQEAMQLPLWSNAFNESVRSLNRNCVMTYIYMLRYLNFSRNLPRIDQSTTSDKWAADLMWLIKKNRRIMAEGSVLAGRDFLPRANSRSPGRWFPNLFDFDPLHENYMNGEKQWHGLRNLRILQYLESSETSQVAHSMLVDQLSTFFNYSKESLDAGIMSMREWGLISQGDVTGAEVHYRIHPKAKFVAHLTLCEPSITYLVAEATAMPSHMRNMLKRHAVGHNQHRNFFEACIPTGRALLRLIYSEYQREMAVLDSSVQNFVGLAGDEKSLLLRRFKSPALSNHKNPFKRWHDAVETRLATLSTSSNPDLKQQAARVIATYL
jgi:hypothetical protein